MQITKTCVPDSDKEVEFLELAINELLTSLEYLDEKSNVYVKRSDCLNLVTLETKCFLKKEPLPSLDMHLLRDVYAYTCSISILHSMVNYRKLPPEEWAYPFPPKPIPECVVAFINDALKQNPIEFLRIRKDSDDGK